MNKKMNILIIDDSGVMRAMILKSLKMCGLLIGDVHQASNGQEGLDVLDKQWIDLVIVDINMPVMNGEEMIRHMKSNPETRNIPILVISTEGSEARREHLLNMGAAFIHKPFSPETIRDTIKEIMGGNN